MNEFITPCIGQCRISDDRSHCIGCKRSILELRGWIKYTTEEKIQVIKELKTRIWEK